MDKEKRVSVINIIVSDIDSASKINDILHEYSRFIIGRMGIPYSEKGVSVICVVIDAPNDVTSSISGKIGMLKGVSSKTLSTKI